MSSRPKLLLIDADPALAQTLSEHLTGAGYDVTATTAVSDPAEFDAIVINDSIDGAAALCAGSQGMTPVLVLGRMLPGAAAQVAKPLRLGLLAARLGEMLATHAATRAIRFGQWRLDAPGRSLQHQTGRRIRLTDKEAAILTLLASVGGVVTRERLLAEVWGYSAAITTHTLETHIYRLRRKIEPDPASARLLITENGGYRLVVD